MALLASAALERVGDSTPVEGDEVVDMLGWGIVDERRVRTSSDRDASRARLLPREGVSTDKETVSKTHHIDAFTHLPQDTEIRSRGRERGNGTRGGKHGLVSQSASGVGKRQKLRTIVGVTDDWLRCVARSPICQLETLTCRRCHGGVRCIYEYPSRLRGQRWSQAVSCDD